MLRIFLIVCALLVAGGVSLLTRNYLSARESHMAPASEAVATAEVLVVTTDLEIGQIVGERNAAWQKWPKANLNAKYITRESSPDAIRTLTGAAARQPLFAGEPVTSAKLVKREGAGILAIMLRDGYRAVTMKVDEAQGLAGLVKPGDRVDILLTHRVAIPADSELRGERNISEVIAHAVRVLAVGQEIKGEDDKNKLAKSITVEVDPRQAEAITLGRSMGTLSLALRSAFTGDDGGGDRPRGFTSDQDISGALRDRHDPPPKVLTARRTLEPGTLLTDADLTWVEISGAADPERHVLKASDGRSHLRGALLTSAIAAGQPIFRSDIVRPTENRFIPLALRAGFRAISVAIAPNTAVAGFVTPGDLVDVIFTDTVDDQSGGAVLKQRNWSEVVAAAVRVLSIESMTDPKTDLPTVGGTVTIEATPRQVETITLAAGMGKLTLALRPASEGTAGESQEARPLSPSLTGSPAKTATYTTDMEMIHGLQGLVTGTSANSPRQGMVVIRGTARSTVQTEDRAKE
ncbi:MAG TPA: Flp pilus assembly protein CpaB [Skermanella sp.]|nr:Flp pilus assembly protein CpaB [Skermanella sp.]